MEPLTPPPTAETAVQRLQEARAEWRARHMALEDAMRELMEAKAAFDRAYGKALERWGATAAAVNRWRDAAHKAKR